MSEHKIVTPQADASGEFILDQQQTVTLAMLIARAQPGRQNMLHSALHKEASDAAKQFGPGVQVMACTMNWKAFQDWMEKGGFSVSVTPIVGL